MPTDWTTHAVLTSSDGVNVCRVDAHRDGAQFRCTCSSYFLSGSKPQRCMHTMYARRDRVAQLVGVRAHDKADSDRLDVAAAIALEALRAVGARVSAAQLAELAFVLEAFIGGELVALTPEPAPVGGVRRITFDDA